MAAHATGYPGSVAKDLSAEYQRPELKVLGTVQELTLDNDKIGGPSDGFTFMGVTICNVSVCHP